MRQSNPLTIILEYHRLTGPNFVDWLRNLKVEILYVLTQSPPEPLPADVSQEERDMSEKWKDDDLQARCIMWASMSNELYKQHEK